MPLAEQQKFFGPRSNLPIISFYNVRSPKVPIRFVMHAELQSNSHLNQGVIQVLFCVHHNRL